jgi:hypothetical protein
MVGAESWDKINELKGEFNALNVFLEFGDNMLAALEESLQKEAQDDHRPGREGGYHGRNGE